MPSNEKIYRLDNMILERWVLENPPQLGVMRCSDKVTHRHGHQDICIYTICTQMNTT